MPAICKIGDSPLYPDSPISEFNPCIQGQRPYGHYVPDEYKGDYTVPDVPNRDSEFLPDNKGFPIRVQKLPYPDVLKIEWPDVFTPDDSTTSKNKGSIVLKVFGFILVVGLFIGGLFFARNLMLIK